MIVAEALILTAKRSPASWADDRTICDDSSKEKERNGIINNTQISANTAKLVIPNKMGIFTLTDKLLYLFIIFCI